MSGADRQGPRLPVRSPRGGEPGRDGPPDALTRRGFLKLAGASAALAGLGACTRPPLERIIPYVDEPPELTPGVPRYYATSMVLGGYATGLLVASRDGRPIKVEGNPEHPASLGAAGVYEQASILQLYDPDRARGITRRGRGATWEALTARLDAAAATRGAGLHLLLEPTSSPLLLELLQRVRRRLPGARVHFHAPLAGTGAREAARLAWGRPLLVRPDLSRAAVVVSLDGDLLAAGPFHLRHARDFALGRRPDDGRMSRLHVAEPRLTPTGAVADERLAVRAGDVHALAAALLHAIGAAPADGPAAPELPEPARRWVEAAARDLRLHRGAGVVVVGERQPPEVQALAHLLDDALGNVGRTVRLCEPVLPEPESGLAELAAEIRAGRVRTLVVLEGNPAYAAPADLELPALLRRVPESVYLGLYADETAAACGWHVPALHYLEQWGDARAFDGTLSPVQPLIRPLYDDARSAGDLLARLAGEGRRTQHELLRAGWLARLPGADFEAAWAEALRRGVVPHSAAPTVAAAARRELLPALLRPATADAGAIEIVYPQDPSVHDGRFANLGWLQELPDPVTKLTWENAALVSPATARRLGVEDGELVRLESRGREVSAPVLTVPGHADDSVSLALGYGRAGAETVARAVGADANRIRTTATAYLDPAVRVSRVLEDGAPVRRALAVTQRDWATEGRELVLHAPLAEYRRRGRARPRRPQPTLYAPFAYRGEQWAMTIDLSRCTGCSACMVACQAENNVPVVGREGVLRRREMHWLRIDRYLPADEDGPPLLFQPMLCQHCEKAPCEYVCPVNATVHSADGLNEMVYNRCVGTRFCSNNCPYKVRRFNWFDYNQDKPETERMLMNPDVTVRARGVMEKCTYCVQRIRRHQIAEQTGVPAPTLEPLRTACQQSCPTRAIVFGSLGEPDSEVSRSRRSPRSYALLDELGTEPRTRYLERITNPAPAAPAAPGAAG